MPNNVHETNCTKEKYAKNLGRVRVIYPSLKWRKDNLVGFEEKVTSGGVGNNEPFANYTVEGLEGWA